jgi:hypothetical protein
VGDDYAEATLAFVTTTGKSQPEIPLPTVFPAVEDFRLLPVAQSRTITFLDGDNNTFLMDSGDGPKQFDPARVDSTIVAGTVEEWTINNASGELHVFHIHQTDFQVTEVNGEPQEFIGHLDNVNVPYQEEGGPPGQVKLLIDFRNPDIVGKFVYHCHILEHEDGGMMSVAEVVSPLVANPLTDRPRSRVTATARTPVEAAVMTNTLRGFQAGTYCSVNDVPGSGPQPRARVATGFRVERVPAPAPM